MRIQRLQVSLSTSDELELAKFYARLLNGEIVRHHPPSPEEPDGSGWTHLEVATEEGEFRINFEYDEEWQPPVWPSEPNENIMTQHICIFVYDLEEAVNHAQECGATLDPNQFEESIRVMRDPHGHPFCIIRAYQE